MLKKLLLAVAFSLSAGSAFATCGAIPLTIKDASAAIQNISSATAADGNCKTYIDADTASQIHTDLTAAVPAGTNLIGFVTPTPSTTGGWSKFSTPKNNSNTALTTTVVAVKSSAAGTFGGYYVSNPNTSTACLQVFDVATAGAVTLGTTRPDMVFCIPAATGNPGAANLEITNGVNMANGIQIAATTTASGLTAPSTGLDVTILYK